MKIKKGDTIIVIAGKDQGKKGKVLRVFRSTNKVLVEGVNLSKRRERPKKEGQKGQIVSVTMPLHASNVLFFDSKKNEGTRIGKKKVGDKWVRIAKKSGVEI
jgi:large subunit ribosomal protein L24